MPRLLLAEDEPDIAESIEALLSAFLPDVEVTVAQNGLQALELLRKGTYDALLTDYKMPLMDGLELIKHVYTEQPWLNVLLYTAFKDAEFMAKILAEHPDLKVIAKPLEIDFFLDQIKKAVSTDL